MERNFSSFFNMNSKEKRLILGHVSEAHNMKLSSFSFEIREFRIILHLDISFEHSHMQLCPLQNIYSSPQHKATSLDWLPGEDSL